jgi:hypothetical protein
MGKVPSWDGSRYPLESNVLCTVPSAVLGDASFELSMLHFYNCPTLDGYNGCGQSRHLGLSYEMSTDM